MSAVPTPGTEPSNPAARQARALADMPRGLPLRALPLFYFLHVHKTAGTSLRMVLNQMFRPYVHITTAAAINKEFKDTKRRIWLEADFYEKHILIGGHIPYLHPIVQSKRPQRRKVFASVLRDPVARVVSHYDYIRRHPDHWLHGEVLDRSLLEAFRASERFRKVHVNEQLRIVFGTPSVPEAEDILAKQNYILATMDKLEGFVDAISASSGLARPPAIPHVNGKTDSSQPAMQLAHEQPDFDLAVELIREANRPEEEFIARNLRQVLVTTSLAPVIRAFPPKKMAA